MEPLMLLRALDWRAAPLHNVLSRPSFSWHGQPLSLLLRIHEISLLQVAHAIFSCYFRWAGIYRRVNNTYCKNLLMPIDGDKRLAHFISPLSTCSLLCVFTAFIHGLVLLFYIIAMAHAGRRRHNVSRRLIRFATSATYISSL